MITESQAIDIANRVLAERSSPTLKYHSIGFINASQRPAFFRDLGDLWVVRYSRVLPPDQSIDPSMVMIHVSASTGEIVKFPR